MSTDDSDASTKSAQAWWKRLWPPTSMGEIAAVVGAVAAVAAIVVSIVLSPTERSNGRPKEFCFPKLESEAPAIPGNDNAAAGDIRLVSTSYRARELFDGRIDIAVRGKLAGKTQQGNVLYLITQPDPATTDSTPEHHPGSGRYFLAQRISPDEEGCFSYTEQSGYPGFCGITTRFFVTLMSPDTASALESQRAQNQDFNVHGFSRDELGTGVFQLQYFEVPSKHC